MNNWLHNLVGRLGLALLKFSFNRRTKRPQEPRSLPRTSATILLLWTQKEAEAAWEAGRTDVNLATMLPVNTSSAKTVSGRFRVDGRPTRVVVCRDEEIRSQMLMTMENEKAQRRKAMEEQWRKNGCFKDSSGNWVVPDELMWRSLPHGEDR